MSKTNSVSFADGEINKNMPTFDLNEIIKTSLSTIVGSTKQLFQLFDSLTECPKFIKKYNEVFPLELRNVLVKQMSIALMALSKTNNLPIVCSFIVDGKLCFDTYPTVLSALAVETYSQIPASSLQEAIQYTSEILREFALLIELLDKDIQNYITSLGITYLNERVEKRKLQKMTEFENSMNHDQIIMNLISQGDIEIKEMRKFTKELFCVANSLKTTESNNGISKGIIVRHGSMLLRQIDKYNKRIMVNTILILYPSGLQMYVIPLHDKIIESIWISIDHLTIGNITGLDGEFYNEGWCVLSIGDKSNDTTYNVCSTSLLTTLMWHDDMVHCVSQSKANDMIKVKEIILKNNLSEQLPATVFSVIKELMMRGCSCFKIGHKIKTTGILKRTLQTNPQIELNGVPIDEIASFFIEYLKEMKPKLLNKNDVVLFNKIDYKAADVEFSYMFEFFDSKDIISRSILLSLFFLINCFLINGEDCSFKVDDGIKLLHNACDSTFKKKCYDFKRMKYVMESIHHVTPKYAMKNVPLSLVRVMLMKEPIRVMVELANSKYGILFEQHLICFSKDEKTLSVHLPHNYLFCCSCGDYIFIANEKYVTKIFDIKVSTMEFEGIRSIAVSENVLIIAFDNRVEFIDCQTFEPISTYRLSIVETIKTRQTSFGFIVVINKKTVHLFDIKGSLLLTKDFEFLNKEITVINCKDGIILFGFNDGSISVLNETNANEIEIIIAFEGSIKDIAMGNEHYYALTSNNSILVIDKVHYSLLSVFTPLSTISSLLIPHNEILLMSSFNSLLHYCLNSPPTCTTINLSPFYTDIPQCMSSLNHSFVPNYSHVKCNCLICNKSLTSHDLICRCL